MLKTSYTSLSARERFHHPTSCNQRRCTPIKITPDTLPIRDNWTGQERPFCCDYMLLFPFLAATKWSPIYIGKDLLV